MSLLTRSFLVGTLAGLLSGLACTPTGDLSIARALQEDPTPDLASGLVAEPSPPADDPALTPLGEPGSVLAREAIPHHDPRFHDHFQEGMVLVEQGDVGGAIDHLRMAVFDAPESAATWYELGQAYVTAGRKARGVECMLESVAREPRHADAQRFLSRHFLGRGEPERARPHVQALARVAGDDFRTSHLQSRLFLALDMWEQAISASRRTVALNPEFIYAYNNLGFAALQVGRDELAVQYLEAATELTPLEPYMLNNLGVAYERMGRHGDALAAFGRAAAQDGTYVKAVGNRDRMQRIVDREVADEVARILAARAGAGSPDVGMASAEPTP
jgi:predicted Zn-dependent protease